ncbi:Chlorophyll a-b binding protein CP29.3, chloroplastic [Linum perenne]
MAAAASAAVAATRFIGTQPRRSQLLNVQARFGFLKKKPAPKPKKVAPPAGDRLVWFPGANPPEWLDGSMVGDRGFDPLGLAKPAEYLQFDFDSLDQNLAKNLAGDVIGVRTENAEEVKPTPFQPYDEVFGIQRFRECELIHGRWAMLGTLGALAVEGLTGVAWQDAGKQVELVEGASYLGQPLPFSLTTLIWIEVLVIGFIEFQRNAELDPEKRLYPGGYFDPLGLASDPEKKESLQLAEIKHSRLAMVAFLIFGIQAAYTGKGPISFLATFSLQ